VRWLRPGLRLRTPRKDSQKPGFFPDLIAAAKDFVKKPGFFDFGASTTVKIICVDLG